MERPEVCEECHRRQPVTRRLTRWLCSWCAYEFDCELELDHQEMDQW